MAFGLSAMNFSRSSTRFSGFFSAMAVLNALASSGSSCGVSAGFWVSPAAAAAALGSGGFCPAPLCARGHDVAATTRASIRITIRRLRGMPGLLDEGGQRWRLS